MERPTCACHGEPMHRNGVGLAGQQWWRCAVRNREKATAWHYNAPYVLYAGKLLKTRRRKALLRMQRRAER